MVIMVFVLFTVEGQFSGLCVELLINALGRFAIRVFANFNVIELSVPVE